MTLLKQTIANITEPDAKARRAARTRLESLAMPYWALGRLLDLAESLAAITDGDLNLLKRRVSVVMAGDHGVVAEGVSQYPQSVTRAMVSTMLRGGAAINALAATADSRVMLVDLGVAGEEETWQGHPQFLALKIAPGTANIARGPAMTNQQAITAICTGIEVADMLEADIYGVGEMGIGNTTPATAIGCAMLDLDPGDVTGKGTGIDDEVLSNKIEVIRTSLRVNQPRADDGLDVLQKVGGFEIGGMVGLMLAAAARHRPVILDGLISTSAALIAERICPQVSGYLFASHRSVEPCHTAMLKHLGLEPFLDLDLRLGEGTGAALMMPLIDSAVAVYNNMFTLDEALNG